MGRRATLDAQALGGAVDVQWIHEIVGQNGDAWSYNLLLVVKAQDQTMAVRVTGFGAMMESDDHHPGELIPKQPGGSFDDEMGIVPAWPAASPPLYAARAHVPGADDWLGLAHEGDQLVLHHFYTDTDEEADTPVAWRRIATIELAPGARVTPR